MKLTLDVINEHPLTVFLINFCRWFQNSKVQKVVKDSKMQSKVRTSIKVKLNKPVVGPNPATTGDDSAASGANPDTKNEAGGTDDSLPVIGSMEEYAKIVGKSVKAIQVKKYSKWFDVLREVSSIDQLKV